MSERVVTGPPSDQTLAGSILECSGIRILQSMSTVPAHNPEVVFFSVVFHSAEKKPDRLKLALHLPIVVTHATLCGTLWCRLFRMAPQCISTVGVNGPTLPRTTAYMPCVVVPSLKKKMNGLP